MGNEVARTKTPVSAAEAATYIEGALTSLLGRRPTRNVALFTLALAWCETGRGQGMIANSPGNVMAKGIRDGAEYSVWSGDYWRPQWWDVNWSNKEMREGRWPSAFRAYPNMAAGFKDFVAAVTKRAALVAAMASGDALAVVRALNATKYSPDYGAKHEPTFSKLVAEFRKQGLFADLPESSSGSGAVVVGCVAFILGGLALAYWRTHR